MRRLVLPVFAVLALASFIIAPTLASRAMASGPPPTLAKSLTANGRVIWNLDALLNDTFGNRVECYDGARNEMFSVAHGAYCPAPLARYQTYVFTFLNAFHSQFRLVQLAKPPFTGATSGPLRVGSRYISCPGGEYHHGGRGWLVQGGGAGPNGEFWCN